MTKQIEKLDSKIRDVTKNLNNNKESIKPYVPKDVQYEKYIKWDPIEDIDNQINQKKVEIEKHQRELQNSKKIIEGDLLKSFDLPMIPDNFFPIIEKKMSDITTDAEKRVRNHINSHAMEKQGEIWLSQGLNYVSNNTCPFCGQDINGNDLVAIFRLQFNEAYKMMKQEVAQLEKDIFDKIGESALKSLQNVHLKNSLLFEFWNQFIDMTFTEIEFEDIFLKYKNLSDFALALIQKKNKHQRKRFF